METIQLPCFFTTGYKKRPPSLEGIKKVHHLARFFVGTVHLQ